MKLVRSDAYTQAPAVEGIQRMQVPGMNTRIVACAKGCSIPRHGHARAEEIYVLSGKVRLNEHILGPGDLLRTEAGEFHEAEALEDARFLVVNTLDPQ